MTTHLDGAIADGLHRMLVRVYYEDTDVCGIMYRVSRTGIASTPLRRDAHLP
jgi:hypothetical protein